MRATFLLLAALGCAAPAEKKTTPTPVADSAPSTAPHGEHKEHKEHGGKHYEHSFAGAEKWAAVFDDPTRDEWQKPEAVLSALALPPEAKVADLGAGTGYFSMRLAKQLTGGKVFAVDIEADMVEYLTARATKEGLTNVFAVQGSADDAKIPEPVDLILIVDTYHHIANRPVYFSKLKGSLRPGGRLAIIDFTKEAPMGPPVEHRLLPDEVTKELGEAGYTSSTKHNVLPNQYFLVYELTR